MILTKEDLETVITAMGIPDSQKEWVRVLSGNLIERFEAGGMTAESFKISLPLTFHAPRILEELAILAYVEPFPLSAGFTPQKLFGLKWPKLTEADLTQCNGIDLEADLFRALAAELVWHHMDRIVTVVTENCPSVDLTDLKLFDMTVPGFVVDRMRVAMKKIEALCEEIDANVLIVSPMVLCMLQAMPGSTFEGSYAFKGYNNTSEVGLLDKKIKVYCYLFNYQSPLGDTAIIARRGETEDECGYVFNPSLFVDVNEEGDFMSEIDSGLTNPDCFRVLKF